MFFQLMNGIGFDSEEVKTEVAEEVAQRAAMIEAFQQSMEQQVAVVKQMETLYAEAADCSVCGKALLPCDVDHHVSFTDVQNIVLQHFCSAHCPTCTDPDNQEDD